jgi:hypothetical protein
MIERPLFYEGQILAAADLSATVDHGRAAIARHERYLHTWGIGDGLELIEVKRKTSTGIDYIEVRVTAGIAVDGRGRQVIVAEGAELDPSRFLDLAVFVKDAWHPVFLVGRDEDAPAEAFTTGACDSSQPRRILEGFEIRFGRPGDADELDLQTAADLTEGPEGDAGAEWKILLGFVKWNNDISQFSEKADSADGIGRRYAGVKADEVVARSGRLTIRSRPADQANTPVVQIDEGDGGTFKFGLQNANGVLRALFTIDASGNVVAEGSVKGAKASVWVESGVAFDGELLPLPAGVTQTMVDDGVVIVHPHVTPHYPPPALPPPAAAATDVWMAIPLECEVVEGRRLHCRFEWVLANAAAATPRRMVLGAADYTLSVSTPPASATP